MTQQYYGRWNERPKAAEFEEAKGKIDPLLYNLLSYATPYGTEKDLAKFLPKGCIIDKMGNRIYNVGRLKIQDHGTIFSCHMDTVHGKPVSVYPVITEEGMVYAEDTERKPCVLGADDKVGMWIMLHMMAKKIPGRYIFHVGEEHGCLGSKYIAKETPHMLTGAKRAIAFDRMNYGDIIKAQMGGACCSDTFINGLANDINQYMPPKQQFASATGVFTDTAVYKWLVPECTNLSVGYYSQHTSSEHFDWVWLSGILLPAVLKCEWHKLPVGRDHEQEFAKELEWTRKQEEWRTRPYHDTWKRGANTTVSGQLCLPDKKDEKKVATVITKEAISYKDITFMTPWNQIPDIKPFEITKLPEDVKTDRQGVIATLYKRLRMVGDITFLGEVVTAMLNARIILQSFTALQNKYTDLVKQSEVLRKQIDGQDIVIADLGNQLSTANSKLRALEPEPAGKLH